MRNEHCHNDLVLFLKFRCRAKAYTLWLVLSRQISGCAKLMQNSGPPFLFSQERGKKFQRFTHLIVSGVVPPPSTRLSVMRLRID